MPEVLARVTRSALTGGDFGFGLRLLAEQCPGRWHVALDEPLPRLIARLAPLLRELPGPWVLIPDAAVIVADGSLAHLLQVLESTGAPAVVASEPAAFPEQCPPDYLTARGLDRYAARCRALAPGPFAGGPAALAVVRGEWVARVLGPDERWHWPEGTLLVPGAAVHPFGDYHAGERKEVLPHLPPAIGRLLDVGGGEGRFAASVRRRWGCEAHVAELSPVAAASARAVVDRVWEGDFFHLPIDTRFDCITALDVIEHFADPLAVLSRVHALLEPGGSFVSSIPNLGHWSVIADLLEGRWDYLPVGIACHSHLRFFTRRTIADFWSRAGFKIEKIEPIRVLPPPPVGEVLDRAAAQLGIEGAESDREAYQYIVVARRA